jgi:hypothetical protein
MFDLILLDNELLGQHFHGIDAHGVSLPDLEHLAIRPFTDQFQDFKIFRSDTLLVGLPEGDAQMYFARNMISRSFTSL